MKIYEAYVDLEVRMAKLERGLRQAQTAVQRQSAAMARPLGGIQQKVASIASAFGMMQFASVAAFAMMAKASFRAYVELERMDALFDTVFKERAPEMRRWAADYAKGVGLSASATRQLVSEYYLLLSGLGVGADRAEEMARNLTRVTNAIAAVRGLDPERFQRAVIAGMTGMTQSLLRIGISLKEEQVRLALVNAGLADQKRELTESEKLYGRYLALLDQTKTDQEAFARGVKTTYFALIQQRQAWQDLKEAIGEAADALFDFRMRAARARETTRLWEGWIAKIKGVGAAGGAERGRVTTGRILYEFLTRTPYEAFARLRHEASPIIRQRIERGRLRPAGRAESGDRAFDLFMRYLETGRLPRGRTRAEPERREGPPYSLAQWARWQGPAYRLALGQLQMLEARTGKRLGWQAAETFMHHFVQLWGQESARLARDLSEAQTAQFERGVETIGRLLPRTEIRRGRPMPGPGERFERLMQARQVYQDVAYLERTFGRIGPGFLRQRHRAMEAIQALAPEFFGPGAMRKFLEIRRTPEEETVSELRKQTQLLKQQPEEIAKTLEPLVTAAQ